MGNPVDCRPWFVAKFAPLTARGAAIIRSGCSIGADGNIPCQPEAMRKSAEAQLRAAGFDIRLDLATYTLARYMQGEVGSGTIEERVAVGEAAVNRAKLERLPNGVLSLLLYRQTPQSKCWPGCERNRGWYGPIHGVGTGVSTAPYGRWATTSADPSILTLLLADFVMSGESRNFTKGADDQDGPEYWISKGQAALHGYVRNLAARGKYWVGPLPGIDHWHTFLQYTPGIKVDTPAGQALLQRGLAALTLPRGPKPNFAAMPICPGGPPASSGLLWTVGMFGLVMGAWWFTHRHGRATTTP